MTTQNSGESDAPDRKTLTTVSAEALNEMKRRLDAEQARTDPLRVGGLQLPVVPQQLDAGLKK